MPCPGGVAYRAAWDAGRGYVIFQVVRVRLLVLLRAHCLPPLLDKAIEVGLIAVLPALFKVRLIYSDCPTRLYIVSVCCC